MSENDGRDWMAEGWHSFYAEVLRKEWPDSSAMTMVLSLAFYGGAHWVLHVLRDEGLTPEVVARIEKEIAEHAMESLKQQAARE